MSTVVTLAFLHHAAAFVIVGVLTAELVLLGGELTLASARTLLRMDAVYGVAAMLLLIVGFCRVLYTEKGPAYYFYSIPFLVKISLFLIVGLLSIYPTFQYLGWRGALRAGKPPVLAAPLRRRLRMIVHIELTLLFVIMLCAAMMARLIGFVG
jgi:putative membrane protein